MVTRILQTQQIQLSVKLIVNNYLIALYQYTGWNAKRTSDPHTQVSDDNKITLVKEITDYAKKNMDQGFPIN